MIIQIQPNITQEDIDTVTEYLKTTWVTEGPATKDFEEMFSKYTGAKHSLAFCNGTMTLFSALKALWIGKWDEVIVPAITFTATVNAVLLSGATPVVVDIDFDHLGMTVETIKTGISPKTKAIMPVHLYGYCLDIESIALFCKDHGYFLIEDAAQAVGVRQNGKHAGTFGEFGSFSFYGNKTITTGEGGMLITGDDTLKKKAYSLKNHGRQEKGVFVHEEIGYNFSISDMQSALGVSQMRKLDYILSEKKRIYDFYSSKLAELKEVQFHPILPGTTPSFWFTNIILEDKQALLDLATFLKENGIQTRRAFYPIHLQPCYQNNSDVRIASDCIVVEDFYERILSLPSTVAISEEDLTTVVSKIIEFFQNR